MTLTPAQLELRTRTLGASEVAAACGISPHRRPIEVWARKVGLAPAEDAATARRFRLGHAMEEAVAGEYRELCGLRTSEMSGYNVPYLLEAREEWPDHDGTVFHSEHSWATATPDRVVVASNGGEWKPTRLVELKTTAGFGAQEWDGYEGTDGFYVGDVPIDYEAQCLWQMLVTGVHACDLAVLINGSEFRAYHIAWNEAAAMALFARAEKWWSSYVTTRVAPPSDGSDAWGDVWEKLHPEPKPGLMMKADAETCALAKRYVELTATEAAAKKEKERIKQTFIERIGDDLGYGNRDEGVKVTWDRGDKGRTDWQQVAKAMNADAETIAKHTAEPTRRFDVRVKNQGEK